MIRLASVLFAAALVAAPALADHGPKKAPKSDAAHADHKAMVTASAPADGATVKGSPAALALTFAHPMSIHTVALTGPDGKTAAVPVARSAPSTKAAVPLPALRPGAWRAAWKAVGSDGHAMTGVIRFTVD